MEILVRGLGVANLKLHGLSFLDGVPDDDRPSLLICSNEIANKEITSRKVRAMFVHGDTDMERRLYIAYRQSSDN